ncbi:MAG: type II toxin-antitoxin system VapC family toxin [Planctomycetes bacterium]|nr:type II toxin-antitoxin system VapC family toxin [Planctomycetota bacterium]
MKYVLDVSVALSWVIPRPLTAMAVRLRDEYQQQLYEVIAPAHFPQEVANALTKAERQKLVPIGDARKLIQDVLNAAPVLHSVDPLFYRAVDISSQTRSAFYDCLYIALGEREGCELVTADDKLVRDLQTRFPFIIHLSQLP